MTTVHFSGGPWDGQSTEIEQVVAPVFAVGHEVGNHYWLDTKSDPPTYHWDDAQGWVGKLGALPPPDLIDGSDHA